MSRVFEEFDGDFRGDDKPLIITFSFLSFLCSVARNANLLLDAVLNHQPMAAIVRDLARDFYDLEMHALTGLAELDQEFLESNFVRAEIDHSVKTDARLQLWTNNSASEDSE